MNEEEALYWLYRMRSTIKIWFPTLLVDKCEKAIDYAISKLKGE